MTKTSFDVKLVRMKASSNMELMDKEDVLLLSLLEANWRRTTGGLTRGHHELNDGCKPAITGSDAVGRRRAAVDEDGKR
uniref:Uncharacterized protein n=1 Tax=Oryza meridionalis TaxID=40149 RepID=A0A0E0EJA0_9ORYZ